METSVGWNQPECVPELAPDEVQVWRLAVQAADARLEWARTLLAPDELARMERVRAGVARDEFVLGRGVLRALLGNALKVDACGIAIAAGANGKPFVDSAGIEFNVAHSRGIILIALCRDAVVGVDVEWADREIEALEIAERNFAVGEQQKVAAASGPERVREFCRIWAKKEAVVKAHGQGLTVGLDSFDVSGRAEALVQLDGQGYSVRELEIGDGFAGAVATEGRMLPVRMFDLSDRLLRDMLDIAG